MKKTLAIAIGCLALAHAPAFSEEAAAYPGRPVKVIVVENRPGANAMLGADAVATSAPDGHTLLAAAIAHTVNVSLFPNASYRLERDLQAITIVSFVPLVPVVRVDTSIRSLQDLVVASKSRVLNAGSAGSGTATHLALELFKNASGAEIQHVPYKGGVQAMTDLLGGRIDLHFAVLPAD